MGTRTAGLAPTGLDMRCQCADGPAHGQHHSFQASQVPAREEKRSAAESSPFYGGAPSCAARRAAVKRGRKRKTLLIPASGSSYKPSFPALERELPPLSLPSV
jgi:hypothetical protein